MRVRFFDNVNVDVLKCSSEAIIPPLLRLRKLNVKIHRNISRPFAVGF